MVKKVLLADDEEGVRGLLSATFGNDPRYTLLIAKDGDEALALALKEKPGLAFLDVRMPKKDGFEVCRMLKNHPDTASIKVVLLTGMSEGDDVGRGREAGADGYLTKPFSPTVLLQRVEEMVAESPE